MNSEQPDRAEQTEVGNQPLTDEQLELINAYWRAANYLSVGQIYLMDNPLLKEPLAPQHIKPRLLGHWGTVPGLNMIYVHLNRVIKARDLNMIFITGQWTLSIACRSSATAPPTSANRCTTDSSTTRSTSSNTERIRRISVTGDGTTRR